MVPCVGPPVGNCPNEGKTVPVKLCQGDLMLCADCETGRFGSTGRTTRASKAQASSASSDGGVIVNELLCFICNKMDVMPADLVIKLVSSFYDEKQIESAKRSLFELIPHPSLRFISRKGDKKNLNNVQDMLGLLLQTKTERIPAFVAMDLANLPPLSEDHFDVSKLFREIQALRLDVNNLKDSKVMPAASGKACGVSQHVQTEPRDVTEAPNLSQESDSTDTVVVHESDESEQIPSGQGEPSRITDSEITTDEDDLSALIDSQFADAVRHNINSQPRNVPNRVNRHGNPNPRQQQRYPVTRPRHGQSSVMGSAVDIKGLRAVSRYQYSKPNVPGVFLSRLHPRTSEEDIARHIREKTGLRLKVQRLRTKYRHYSSFHVAIEKSLMARLFVSKMWPRDTLVKEYEFKNNFL